MRLDLAIIDPVVSKIFCQEHLAIYKSPLKVNGWIIDPLYTFTAIEPRWHGWDKAWTTSFEPDRNRQSFEKEGARWHI
jgi:hypothetical protein